MVAEVRPEYDTEWAAMKAVAQKLGIGTTETLRKWVRQDQVDAGVLKEQISKVFEANYRVYGARKIWRELNRQGHRVARCTAERLMRELGIAGAVRGKRVITTVPGGRSSGPRTFWSATSSPAPRTAAGSRTSPT
ncbi:IS3 family transposase [Streptomyces sp. NPDC056817]|uniref:IS3 family transposase n=1 Tax=Streptomyces sp. NPDC056817 TaxID=3345950 RepID=UPI00368082A4